MREARGPCARRCLRFTIARMTETFRKLNFKGQSPILILGAPDTFGPEIERMQDETEVHTRPAKGRAYAFILAFGAIRAELEKAGRTVVPLLDGDAVSWFAYPKGTSKRYKSDVNRDSLWALLGPLGIRAVRQIAIDEDWSALRFRRAEYVKS